MATGVEEETIDRDRVEAYPSSWLTGEIRGSNNNSQRVPRLSRRQNHGWSGTTSRATHNSMEEAGIVTSHHRIQGQSGAWHQALGDVQYACSD